MQGAACKVRALALALVAIGLIARAQEPPQTPPQPRPTFRGGITIVPLNVTVLDKNGKPVPLPLVDENRWPPMVEVRLKLRPTVKKKLKRVNFAANRCN